MNGSSTHFLAGLVFLLVTCFLGLSGCTETVAGTDPAHVEETDEVRIDQKRRVVERFHLPSDSTISSDVPVLPVAPVPPGK